MSGTLHEVPGGAEVPAAPSDQAQCAPTPPSLGLTILVSVIFGPFGAIPAAKHSGKARSMGLSGARYWRAFFLSWLASWAAGAVASLLFLAAILGSFGAATQSAGSTAPIVQQSSAAISLPVTADAPRPPSTKESFPNGMVFDASAVKLGNKPGANDYEAWVRYLDKVQQKAITEHNIAYLAYYYVYGSGEYRLARNSFQTATDLAPNMMPVKSIELSEKTVTSFTAKVLWEAKASDGSYTYFYQLVNDYQLFGNEWRVVNYRSSSWKQ